MRTPRATFVQTAGQNFHTQQTLAVVVVFVGDQKESAHSSACAPAKQVYWEIKRPWGGVRFSTKLHSEVAWADRRHLGPRKARASNTGGSIWTQVMKAQPETKDKSPQGSHVIRSGGLCVCACVHVRVCLCVHVRQCQIFCKHFHVLYLLTIYHRANIEVLEISQ